VTWDDIDTTATLNGQSSRVSPCPERYSGRSITKGNIYLVYLVMKMMCSERETASWKLSFYA